MLFMETHVLYLTQLHNILLNFDHCMKVKMLVFFDLLHLVKRCYNTLKEVGVPMDMDNSHMLSIIEQKMCTDDTKEWARDLEKEKGSPTRKALMSWMTVETKSRMRATAPIRAKSVYKRTVSQFRSEGYNSSNGSIPTWHRCWLCLNSQHWPDQCPKFAALSTEDRLKAATKIVFVIAV